MYSWYINLVSPSSIQLTVKDDAKLNMKRENVVKCEADDLSCVRHSTTVLLCYCLKPVIQEKSCEKPCEQNNKHVYILLSLYTDYCVYDKSTGEHLFYKKQIGS